MVIAQLILTDGTDCRRTADDVLVSNVRLLADGTAARRRLLVGFWHTRIT